MIIFVFFSEYITLKSQSYKYMCWVVINVMKEPKPVKSSINIYHLPYVIGGIPYFT